MVGFGRRTSRVVMPLVKAHSVPQNFSLLSQHLLLSRDPLSKSEICALLHLASITSRKRHFWRVSAGFSGFWEVSAYLPRFRRTLVREEG